MEKKVVSCRITAMPKSMFDPMPEVWIKLEGEQTEEKLFTYYPDEISCTPEEFIGKTIAECRHIHYEKDRRYMLSGKPPSNPLD